MKIGLNFDHSKVLNENLAMTFKGTFWQKSLLFDATSYIDSP
jgi:hypothetical protein